MSRYQYRSSNDGCIELLFYAVIIAILLGLAALTELPNRITVDQAVERFYELSKAEKIVVVRHSNNSIIFGETRDVTFELLVDGKPETGRCTSGLFSPMVCRLYAGGD